MRKLKFATRAIHVGEEPNVGEGGTGDVVVPIHVATTFARKEVESPTGGYEYSRTGNPTRHALEKRLATLENAKFGLAFASGMAAEATLILSILKKGDHIIAFDDLYGGTKRLFNNVLSNFGLECTYVDARKPKNVKKAINKNTRMIWLETPTNPLMKLCDIRKISELGKSQDLIIVVDNTFMSPYFQNPLALGADIVVHSTTKYLNGHSDMVGGVMVVNDEDLHARLRFIQNAVGAVPGPFDCWLALRGTKTLALRMARHEENARFLADFLDRHPAVHRVNYPGLKSHPQHELAKRQARGFGGMISFDVGSLENAGKLLGAVRLFTLAESLGGVESLISHPATMTHASVPPEEREKLGITDGLVRISVGIEDAEDLRADLENALRIIE